MNPIFLRPPFSVSVCEFPSTCLCTVFVAVELPSGKVSVKEVDAAPPPANTTLENSGDNLLTTLLGLICGAFCKDTPLSEIIPAPTEATQATASYCHGMSSKEQFVGFKTEIALSCVACFV